MKTKNNSLINFGIILFLLYAFFVDFIEAKLGSIFLLGMWVLVLILVNFHRVKTMRFKVRKYNIILIFIVLSFVLIGNAGLKNGSYMGTIKFIFLLSFMFSVKGLDDYYNKFVKYVIWIGMIHVVATYIFFAFPSLYNGMYRIWGVWPGGTALGQKGYKAALCDHYSGNAIVIAITYLSAFSCLMAKNERMTQRYRISLFIIFALSFVAVVLTTKRAHLLFGVLSMIIVYYFCNPKQIHSKAFKLVLMGVAVIPLLYYLSLKSSYLSDVLSRFQDIDEDSHMMSRFGFWRLAIDMFKNKPLFGNGWMYFKYNSPREMNAHNVYIQLLAEVGIIGFFLYLSIMSFFLIKAFRLLHLYSTNKNIDRSGIPLFFAASFLVFYMLYSFTGNCLYDNVEPFFFAACGIVLGSYKREHKILTMKKLKAVL